ncbi:multifunctional CCA addition/repair protein [Thioalkalivibrio thiocyanodenitrificans]|uniref:multifunctional CCA addition/repair protein n=1 Tax=Thioalkalivibrio thiocyanodenitrificans TaxID=243063 RepID=UPI000372821D|nr:multifunctional CCA addition/repair protein [Thioalkalivibrio thiocyanodenitrificans]
MDIYLVGGAVRDSLLGKEVRDRDYVIVGATAEDVARLESEGYAPVGKDFPVFLHPKTKEEYALARRERKVAPGHTGFAVEASPEITLEEDLSRRDLTINAMAQASDGSLIDPFNGAKDLKAGILRHVSDAFREDPLRVLRVARFAARYDFQVAWDTFELMRDMVSEGLLESLSTERVWAETQKALGEPSPQRYFEILRITGALKRLFPEVACLFGVPQPVEHHPEKDSGVHTLMVLKQAAALSDDPVVRFCALVHDLGKGVTPEAELPKHQGHEEAGVALIEQMSERLRIPTAYRQLGRLVSQHHLRAHRAFELRAGSVLKVLEALDALKRPERLETFLLACEADARGRLGREDHPYPQAEVFRVALSAAKSVDAKPLAAQGYGGAKLGELLRAGRIRAIKKAVSAIRPA